MYSFHNISGFLSSVLVADPKTLDGGLVGLALSPAAAGGGGGAPGRGDGSGGSASGTGNGSGGSSGGQGTLSSDGATSGGAAGVPNNAAFGAGGGATGSLVSKGARPRTRHSLKRGVTSGCLSEEYDQATINDDGNLRKR